MIDDIRWLYKSNGEKVLQANDGYVWFDVSEVGEDGVFQSPDPDINKEKKCT